MKKKLQEVRNFLEQRKTAAQNKLAKRAENKISDEAAAKLQELVEALTAQIAQLDALEEEASNEAILSAINAVFANFAQVLQEAENATNNKLSAMQAAINAKNAKKERKRMNVLRSKMVKGVAKNYVDLSAWTPETETDYVPTSRPIRGILKGFDISETSKQAVKVRSFGDFTASFAAVDPHNLKTVVEFVGAQKIVNITKFAGIIQGVADEDIWEDDKLEDAIELEALAMLAQAENFGAFTLLTANAGAFTNPYGVTLSNTDMRTQVLAVIECVKSQIGNVPSEIAVAMHPAQWALLDDLRNANGTPISSDIINNSCIRIEDANVALGKVLAWPKAFAKMRIYRRPEMKWFDSGVRAVVKDETFITEVDFDQQKATSVTEEIVTSVNTAWQMNERDLRCEEAVIMYLRAAGLVFYEDLADIATVLES
jgi:hypothetical protein